MVNQRNSRRWLTASAATVLSIGMAGSQMVVAQPVSADTGMSDDVRVAFDDAGLIAPTPTQVGRGGGVAVEGIKRHASTTDVTWSVTADALAAGVGGSVLDGTTTAVVSLPAGVVADGVVVARGGQANEVAVVDILGDTAAPAPGAVLFAGDVGTDLITKPDLVARYAQGLAEAASGVTTLAGLLDDVERLGGGRVIDVDPETLSQEEAASLVPYLVAMTTVMSGENAVDAVASGGQGRSVLLLDIGPGEKVYVTVTVDIPATGGTDALDGIGEQLTATVPSVLVNAANDATALLETNQVAEELTSEELLALLDRIDDPAVRESLLTLIEQLAADADNPGEGDALTNLLESIRGGLGDIDQAIADYLDVIGQAPGEDTPSTTTPDTTAPTTTEPTTPATTTPAPGGDEEPTTTPEEPTTTPEEETTDPVAPVDPDAGDEEQERIASLIRLAGGLALATGVITLADTYLNSEAGAPIQDQLNGLNNQIRGNAYTAATDLINAALPEQAAWVEQERVAAEQARVAEAEEQARAAGHLAGREEALSEVVAQVGDPSTIPATAASLLGDRPAGGADGDTPAGNEDGDKDASKEGETAGGDGNSATVPPSTTGERQGGQGVSNNGGAQDVSYNNAANEALPETGASAATSWLTVSALVLMVIGVGLVVAQRRREQG